MLHIRLALLIFGLVFSFTQAECHFEGTFQEYGERRLDLIAKFLPENPQIFEAGGHFGYDTMKFVAKWPNSTIISFEANPATFKKFLATTQGVPNVHAYNLAVNNYNGVATLHICTDNVGASSLLQSLEWMLHYFEGPKIDVPCVILDDWCRRNYVSHIDFMWLDLEGLELQVLQSSPHVLQTVKVIYTETNFLEFRHGMTQYQALKKFLEESGFTMLAHWYTEGWQGDAIFIRNDLD